MKMKFCLIILCIAALIWNCQETDEYRHLALGGTMYSSTTVPKNTYTADEFFWGTWISMADGKSYNMEEKRVVVGDKWYWNQAGTGGDKLTVADLGTFVKQSDSVIINNSIPYFRQGGANLEYKVRIVGFGGRAGATLAIPLPNKKITAKSETYASYTKDATTDASGDVTLVMPTVKDSQMITVPKDGGGSVIVPNVRIETSGTNVGTIAVTNEGDYSLKVYGNVTDKDGSYMYADKWYDMTLTIKNISDVKAESSFVTVSTDDGEFLFDSADGESFDVKKGQAVSTLQPGMTKDIRMKVQYQNIGDGYIDTGLKVTIKNVQTDKEWEDYVPLRFFAGQYRWTIKAEATEGNSDAALHGFLVYPDKACQYFDIAHNTYVTVSVPSFRKSDKYMLVFCGAQSGQTLSDSTEMYYTVQEGDSYMTIDKSDAESMKYGGQNNTEESAYTADSDHFQAYLSEGKIKYFLISGSAVVPYHAE